MPCIIAIVAAPVYELRQVSESICGCLRVVKEIIISLAVGVLVGLVPMDQFVHPLQ